MNIDLNAFYTPVNVLYNTQNNSANQSLIDHSRVDYLTPLKLQHIIPHPVVNQYRMMYGDPLDKATIPEVIRPPPQPEFFANYPIPFTLNETNNKLVDVVGVYYRNKDLPILQTRL